jgi:membrane-associated protein
MLSFINACIHLNPLAIVQYGGYVGIAILIFAETGLLIGIFFPGDSVLFVAGLLSAGGFISFIPLVLIVVCAAIIGDSTGYWFGTKIGNAIFKKEDSRFFKQEYVARTQKFFNDYGGRAIILARFVPIVRTIAPVLAGVGKMHYSRFLSFNAIGGIVWGAGMISLGYYLGSIIPNSEHYVLPLSLIIIALSFLPILINYLRGGK